MRILLSWDGFGFAKGARLGPLPASIAYLERKNRKASLGNDSILKGVVAQTPGASHGGPPRDGSSIGWPAN